VLVDGQVLREKKLLLDRGLKKAEINCGARTELGQIEFFQPFIESFQTRQLGIDRQPCVFADPAIVFMKTQGGGVQRPGCEVPANEFIRDVIQLCIRL
jgi:hypothetical protein